MKSTPFYLRRDILTADIQDFQLPLVLILTSPRGRTFPELVWLGNSQFPQKMGRQNAEEKEGARYPDEGKKEIKEFPGAGLVEGPDRMKVHEEAEAQPEEQTGQFNHAMNCNQC